MFYNSFLWDKWYLRFTDVIVAFLGKQWRTAPILSVNHYGGYFFFQENKNNKKRKLILFLCDKWYLRFTNFILAYLSTPWRTTPTFSMNHNSYCYILDELKINPLSLYIINWFERWSIKHITSNPFVGINPDLLAVGGDRISVYV